MQGLPRRRDCFLGFSSWDSGSNATPEVRISNPNSSARLNLDRPIQLRSEPKRAASPKRAAAIDLMEIRFRDGGWALLVDDIDEPAWVVSTKAKAMKAARGAARFHQAKLKVYTRSGNCNKVIEPAAA